jgi:hypothetical protein
MAHWHDIDETSAFLLGKKDQQQQKPKKQPIDSSEQADSQKAPGTVVLSNARFIEPEDGFAFNKTCTASVNAELQGDISNKYIDFSLFSEYKGRKEDMGMNGSAIIRASGKAECAMTLYRNSEFYADTQKDSDAAVEYYFVARHKSTNKEITSKRISLTEEEGIIRLLLEDDDGEAFSEKQYQLEIDGTKGQKKRTQKDGAIEEPIPDGAKKGTLILWPDESDEELTVTWELKLGELKSVDTDAGVRERLNSLGYAADDDDPDIFEIAVGQFQSDSGLEPTGILDDKTRKALQQAFGC